MPATQGTSRLQQTVVLHAGFLDQISQQKLDVNFITNGRCDEVNGHLTNCVFDVRTIEPEQIIKQLFLTSLSKFVHDSVIIVSFLKTKCVGSLALAKSKSLCKTLSRDSKRVALRCLADKTTKELLRFVSQHTPTHCFVFREILQQIFCQFTGTIRKHALPYKCPVQCSQNKHGSDKAMFFNLPDKCSCQRLGNVLRPRMALRTFRTTRLPSVRIFGSSLQLVVRTAVHLHGLQR